MITILTLIIGGSSSGKSQFAEDMARDVVGEKLYIASMLPRDNDCELNAKIKAHREMRRDKNFTTCEYYSCDAINAHTQSSNLILLECMSNLLANEMFSSIRVDPNCVDRIIDTIQILSTKTKHLIIVSNDIFHDGSDYDELTLLYMSNLALINQRLAQISSRVVEVVFSIPIYSKE